MSSVVTRSIGASLARSIRVVLHLRWLVIGTVLLAAALCMHYSATRLGINTDTADMISPELPWRRHFIDYRETFPARDRNIVVVVEAPSAERAETFASLLTERLQQQPQLFLSVFSAGAGEFFERNGLLYLSIEQLEALGDRLADAQPLLGLLQPAFNGADLSDVTRRTLGEREDATATALYAELAEAIEAARGAERDPIAWRRLIAGDAAVGGDRMRLVLVRPQVDFERVQPAAAAMEALRSTIDSLSGDEYSDVDVDLTGSVAMEHEEMLSVRRGAGLAGLASLVMVALVLYAALRSWKLLVIALVTLIAGLSGTAAFAAGAVGHLNLLSVAFAVLYIGLGVDFILHVCLRFKELMAAGVGSDDAIVETMTGVGTSLVICAVTTAVGFYAFIPTPFEGVSELGLISGTGMFVSLLVSVTFLPALLAVFTTDKDRRLPPSLIGTASLARLASRPGRVFAGAGVVIVLALAALPRLEFDNNPINLRDPQSESVRALTALAADRRAPLFDLVAVAPDSMTAGEWQEALLALPTVRNVATVESLVPQNQDDKLFVLEDIGLVMGPGFARLERTAPDAEELERSLAELRGELRSKAPLEDAEAELERAIESLQSTLAASDEPRRKAMLDALDADLVGDLPRELERLAAGLRAEPVDRSDLPPELLERWIAADGRELIEITPEEDVSDNSAARRFVESVRAVVPTATGLPVVYQEASRTVVRSFQLALLYASIMVTFLLWLFLRSGADLLRVLLPISIAAGVTAGAAVWLGIPFNFANIIALPLLVGIGVDNGIHIVHRMRTAPPTNGTPFGTSTSEAMLASTLTTIASFGNLAFSPHRGMASMGQLLTLGMLVTLAATLILLPAMLRYRSER